MSSGKAKDAFIRKDFGRFVARAVSEQIDKQDYPNFDPVKAECITQEMLAQGQLGVVPEKGLPKLTT